MRDGTTTRLTTTETSPDAVRPREAELEGGASWRGRLDRAVVGAVERALAWGLDHWLLLANLACALVLIGAFTPPFLREAGWHELAEALHTAYLLICPQRPDHSYFLFDHKLAMEQRMLAMFGAQLVAGLAYTRVRDRMPRPLDLRLLGLLSLPIAWDILSQSFGLRVSDWPTRTWTGALFNLAFAFWFYPHYERIFHGPLPAGDRRTTHPTVRPGR